LEFGTCVPSAMYKHVVRHALYLFTIKNFLHATPV
jgi:hypothetical protein